MSEWKAVESVPSQCYKSERRIEAEEAVAKFMESDDKIWMIDLTDEVKDERDLTNYIMVYRNLVNVSDDYFGKVIVSKRNQYMYLIKSA